MKRKHKVVLLIVLLVVLAAGGAFAAVWFGALKIPGLNIGPKKAIAKRDVKEDKPAPVVAKSTPAPAKKKPVAPAPDPPDPEKGYQKLAAVWEVMDPPAIVAATRGWQDSEIARVLVYMDEEKTAAFLAALNREAENEKDKAKVKDRVGPIMRTVEALASRPTPKKASQASL